MFKIAPTTATIPSSLTMVALRFQMVTLIFRVTGIRN